MPARSETVIDALSQALATDAGRPLVTWYDGSSGERVELSVKTFDNWVNKIANLFADELMLEPGEGVRVRLPTSWQATVILFGVWTAGLRVVAGDADSDVAASVVGPAADPGAVEGQAIACSLRPLGGPFTAPLPEGWLDFAVAVPPQPDALPTPVTVLSDDVALVSDTAVLSHRALVDRAVDAAADLGLSSGGRLLTDANPCDEIGIVTGLVAPLVAGCSVVLISNCDEATRRSIAAQERATVTVSATP